MNAAAARLAFFDGTRVLRAIGFVERGNGLRLAIVMRRLEDCLNHRIFL
jgi:hypothetical protein